MLSTKANLCILFYRR